MKRLHILTGIAAVLVSGSSTWGATIAYEGFDYPNDTTEVNGLSGGTGWAEPWSDGDGDYAGRTSNDDVSLSVDSFLYPTLGDRLDGDGAGEAIRIFKRGVDLSQDNRVIYASLLIAQQEDGGTSGDNVELILTTDGSNSSANRIRFGIGSDEAYFLGSSATTSAGDGLFVTPGQAYFLVLKVTSNVGVGGADLLQMAAYGPGDTVPFSEPTTWTLTDDSSHDRSNVINSVRLATGANTMGAQFDEIRVGDTWAHVTRTPEPSSYALVLIGAAVLFLVRRRAGLA